MKPKSNTRLILALAITIAATGCSAQWINIALQDLPVLTQMSLNIATLVSTLASGKQVSAADLAVIQNISAQASRDLNLRQTLYSEYKANPNSTTLAKIQNVISDLNQNLPSLLQSAHISKCRAFCAGHCRGEPDSDNSGRLRFSDAAKPNRRIGQCTDPILTSTERSEAAVEPAGLRVNWKRECRPSIRAKRAAVKRSQPSALSYQVSGIRKPQNHIA
jgi:hypothetical protein